MADYCFHYTSLQAAQEIIGGGVLRPIRPRRLIYLTDDFYESASEAANNLAILQKPVQIVCIIPRGVVQNVVAVPPTALPLHTPSGTITRVGGGRQFATNSPIPARHLSFMPLKLP